MSAAEVIVTTREPVPDTGPYAAGASCARSWGSSSVGGATWPGWRVLAVVPIVLAIAIRVQPGAQGAGPGFIVGITGNGLFVAFAALVLELPLFLPLAVARSPGTRWPARPTWARCATCSPSRPAGPGCWSSSTPPS